MKKILGLMVGLSACWFVTSSFATGVCGLPPSGYDASWCSCFVAASVTSCKQNLGSTNPSCNPALINTAYHKETESQVPQLCQNEENAGYLPDGVDVIECTQDIDYYDAYGVYSGQQQCSYP